MGQKGDISVLHPQGIVPVLASFPVIVFAYTCHQNVSELFVLMSDPLLTLSDVLHSQRNTR